MEIWKRISQFSNENNAHFSWNKLEMMYTEAAKDVQTEVKVEDYVPPEVKKRAQNKLKENVTQ